MHRRKSLFLVLILTIATVWSQAELSHQENSSLSSLEYKRPAFKFTEVAEGVYCAQGTENLPVWSNALIIVNESDVIIVDSHTIPAAAVALQEELQEITQKPVRYLINSHFHYDHVLGNQSYLDDVDIIGHEFTRDAIASGAANSGRAIDWYMAANLRQLSLLREQLETETDPGKRAGIERWLTYRETLKAGIATVEPKAPKISFKQKLTLYRGDREIRLIFLGRGHTGGDIVVHLPREGVIFTGDLIYERLSYMGNAYFIEWVETLERLKSLEFDWIVPGHGAPFQDRNRIDYFQSYLRDFWERVQKLYDAGVSAAEATKRIDMRDHSERYPGIINVGVHPHAVERAYELLDKGVK